MFNAQEILALKIYSQSITNHPRPMDVQPTIRKNGAFLLDDWDIIEVLKYFFNGEESYKIDPPPNRLKGNPLWKGKEAVIKEAELLLKELKTAENIIQHFKEQREVK